MPSRPRRLTIPTVLVGALLLGACSGAPSALEAAPAAADGGRVEMPSATTTTADPKLDAAGAVASTAAPSPAPAPPPTTAPAPARAVHVQEWAPFARVGDVVLLHPSSHVERIGFHESNHDGARQMEPLPSAAFPTQLESRQRGTGSHSAADVVVHPDAEIRAPVSGVVKRSGSYVLYCDTRDDYAVIEPDGRPGYEVKVLHIDGVRVSPGEHVTAGVTVLAPRPTRLPFDSQVDEHTAEPAWPHTHIEVVDTAIPDKPNPGGGGGCP